MPVNHLPTCLSYYQPVCQPASQPPNNLPANHLPACLSNYQPACHPACQPTGHPLSTYQPASLPKWLPNWLIAYLLSLPPTCSCLPTTCRKLILTCLTSGLVGGLIGMLAISNKLKLELLLSFTKNTQKGGYGLRWNWDYKLVITNNQVSELLGTGTEFLWIFQHRPMSGQSIADLAKVLKHSWKMRFKILLQVRDSQFF